MQKGEQMFPTFPTFHGLEELSLEKCSNIPLAAWQRLQGAEWQLQKGDFRSVFIAGAAKAGEVLMDVLQPCPLIELNFSGCDLGPETWQRVCDGAWLQLRSAPGVPEEEVLRLRQVEAEVIDVEDTTCWSMCAPCGPCGSATETPHRMLLPKRLTGLSAPRYFSKEFRYQDLLQLLQCPLLELDLSGQGCGAVDFKLGGIFVSHEKLAEAHVREFSFPIHDLFPSVSTSLRGNQKQRNSETLQAVLDWVARHGVTWMDPPGDSSGRTLGLALICSARLSLIFCWRR